jgi:hypothetical protein
MASGHNHDMLEDAVTRDPQEPVRFLPLPPDEQPSTAFTQASPTPTRWRASFNGRRGCG